MATVDDACMRCGGPRRGDEEGYICDHCADALAEYGYRRKDAIWLFQAGPMGVELLPWPRHRDDDEADFVAEGGSEVNPERSEP